jgi:hypothetical protein
MVCIKANIAVRPELAEACPEQVEGGEIEDSSRSCFDKLSMNGASSPLVRITEKKCPGTVYGSGKDECKEK